jgi:ribosomal protein S18 acetylase RimI-like enzyme
MTTRALKSGDIPALTAILRATEVFSDDECAIALELMNAVVNDPAQKDYVIFVAADGDDNAEGYVCIGPTPATQGTFDLYWIAVDPRCYGKGTAGVLIRTAEEYICAHHGTLVIVETSSTGKYARTRAFYIKEGYAELARIRQYYKPDDDLIVYGKYFPTL